MSVNIVVSLVSFVVVVTSSLLMIVPVRLMDEFTSATVGIELAEMIVGNLIVERSSNDSG